MSPPQAQFIDLSIGGAATPVQPATIPFTGRMSKEATPLYDGTARALRLHALPKPVAIDFESARWFSFLDALKDRASAGSVSSAQRSTLLSIWERAVRRQPSLRRPAVGVSADGNLRASWSFTDAPGRVFTLEIRTGGEVDWFYRDPMTGTSCGSGDVSTHEFPAEALDFLATNFGASTSGPR